MTNCKHCQGIGYDASGQRCGCNEMPIQFVPVSRWRVALQGVATVVLYLLVITVIIGPTLIMVLTKTSPGEACARPAVQKKVRLT